MKLLLKNGNVVNVFTGEIKRENVLIENGKIIGVGSYGDENADITENVSGKYICPGFIDGHIHIESTMMTPAELAKAVVPHGTTAIVADPHEIANVCGKSGIEYMLSASENIPVTVYMMLPSCVSSTKFDQSGAILGAKDLEGFYSHPRVLGLGEMMDYPGVLSGRYEVLEKINSAKKNNMIINGHAPLLSGKDLDKYILAGIGDDHECSTAEEAKERIRKGQRVMIRQGTAARNLEALLPLFDEPWAHRCLLVSDDKHPADLLEKGHIDDSIRLAVSNGKDPIVGIQMATLWAAECFGLKDIGAIAPGYVADILILNSLETVDVLDVYKNGVCVVKNKEVLEFASPEIPELLENRVRNTFFMDELFESKFMIPCNEVKKCNVIKIVKGELITEKLITEIDFKENNGIDVKRDIIKLAVVERHCNSGNMGIGFIKGLGIKQGAIASSVSHDAHNLIIVGANEKDMALAGNRVRQLGGGLVVANDGEILAELPLPVAGLMNDLPAKETAQKNENLRKKVSLLGISKEIEPFMTTAFVSLPVIPHIKMTTYGLVDVDKQEIVDLFV